MRLTLWEIDYQLETAAFHRRKNVGLHHLALEVESEQKLEELFRRASEYPACISSSLRSRQGPAQQNI